MNIPIIFAIDKDGILPLSVTILSLIDTAKSSTIYEINIFHDGFSQKLKNQIIDLVKNTSHVIHFYYIPRKRFKGCPKNNHGWTEIVYYRLLAPEILTKYDKVLYSDVDVLIKKDLTDLFEKDIENIDFAGVVMEPNTCNTVCHTYFPENTNEYIYISSLLLMNLNKMRKDNTVSKFFETIKTINKRLKFFDLDVLNITCNEIKPLDFKFNVLQSIYYNDDFTNSFDYKFLKNVYSKEELEAAKKDAYIIHYAGMPVKPWLLDNPPNDYQVYLNKVPKDIFKIKSFRAKELEFWERHNLLKNLALKLRKLILNK